MRPAYLFTGDRKWTDRYIVDLLVCGLHTWSRMHREPVVVVSGAAKGLDTIAAGCAQRLGMKLHEYEAKWSEYGRRAGPLRNKEMLDSEDVKAVFAFHNDLSASKGTRDMCRRALRAGIPVYQIRELTEDDLT